MVGPVNNSVDTQKSKKHKLQVFVVILGIILVCGALYYFKTGITLGHNQCSGKDQAKFMQTVSDDTAFHRIPNLKSDVAKIRIIKNYDRDQNCLYPMVSYYIYTGDIKNARKYYDKLSRLYNKSKGLEKIYGKSATPLNTLSTYIEVLEKQDNESRKNDKAFGFTQ